MSLTDDLEKEVTEIFRQQWDTSDGRVVPEPANLRLANHGSRIDATVLYADLAHSTHLVDSKGDTYAAEVYKAFLTCCARIVKNNSGVITAYDGDRIMAVYLGDFKNTNAVKSALKMNYAMTHIIRPKWKSQYPSDTFVPSHAVGIDTSKILVARIGVRNDNDLVWVGRAANHAAKMSALRKDGCSSWISADVYKVMHDTVKTTDGRSMWTEHKWTEMGNRQIYASSWRWGSA